MTFSAGNDGPSEQLLRSMKPEYVISSQRQVFSETVSQVSYGEGQRIKCIGFRVVLPVFEAVASKFPAARSSPPDRIPFSTTNARMSSRQLRLTIISELQQFARFQISR